MRFIYHSMLIDAFICTESTDNYFASVVSIAPKFIIMRHMATNALGTHRTAHARETRAFLSACTVLLYCSGSTISCASLLSAFSMPSLPTQPAVCHLSLRLRPFSSVSPLSLSARTFKSRVPIRMHQHG